VVGTACGRLVGDVGHSCKHRGVEAGQVLEGLDDEQRAVAESLEGPVMVLAGAGTGKTRAITHRIAYGVLTGAHDPRRTLAVTFTNRAAGELRGRLRELGVAGVQARTFHAAALRQLRYFWPRLSDRAFPEIMPSKASLVARALSANEISPDTSLVRDVSSDIEWARVNFFDEHTLPTAEVTRALSLDKADLARVLASYEQAKSDRGVIDFEDVMIVLIGALSSDHSIAREVRTAYRWLTVDEYQDVNPVQHELLTLWRGDRDDVCVVGDPSQTIYSFTGASPDYLLRFDTDHPGATTVRLVRCYRCTPQIVELANALIHSGTSSRNAVTLQSQNAAGPVPVVTDYDDDVSEARAVATSIQTSIAAGARPRDIAVLYRINAQAVEIESALADAGVPVTVRGSERFFDRGEVREAVSRLRAAARFAADAAPAGASLVDDVTDVLSAMGWSSQQPTTTGAVRERWESLAALVELAREMTGATLAEFVDHLDERSAAQFAPVADGVTLASIHAAKGLEWPIVYLIGCSDGLIPLQHAEGEDQIEEERRLLYVAVTRAAGELHVSWARARQPGGRATRKPSRFLDSITNATAPTDRSSVQRGSRRSGSGRSRGRKGPAQCRSCGKALVTPGERTIGRCRTCPSTFDEAFFEELKAWRLTEATQRAVPAYVVFTDATLIAIAEQLPGDRDALSAIPGIGRAKLESYADALLELVATRQQ